MIEVTGRRNKVTKIFLTLSQITKYVFNLNLFLGKLVCLCVNELVHLWLWESVSKPVIQILELCRYISSGRDAN